MSLCPRPFYVASSLDVMRHRGPDGEGIWVSDDRRVGFAHCRLSIIDLSDAAAQPMSDAQGEIWLTYNGEIYNHAELRTELEGFGYRFRTDHCDTEVLIYAYKHWGIECVHRFRGMFAFGLWDSRSRQLWLVRDRIGIKPLYYAVNRGGKLSFASEIKALLEDPAQPRTIDEDAFFHYLSFLRDAGCPTRCSRASASSPAAPCLWLLLEKVFASGATGMRCKLPSQSRETMRRSPNACSRNCANRFTCATR